MIQSNRWLLGYNILGVCDRLSDILLACRIATHFNRKAYFVWEQNRSCGALFERLFKTKVDYLQVKGVWPNVPLDSMGTIGKKGVLGISTGTIAFKEARLLDEHQWVYLTPRYRGHDYSNLDDIIEPSEEVAQLVNKYIIDNWVGTIVGVHMRQTDKKSLGAPDASKYALEMDKILEVVGTCKFFVASDDIECIEALVKRYGNRILTYPVRTLQRSSPLGTIDAVAILFLLRKTVGTIGSFFSGFSLCAGWNQSITNVASNHLTNYPSFGGSFEFPSVLEGLMRQNDPRKVS
jgi:hypothetical protein